MVLHILIIRGVMKKIVSAIVSVVFFNACSEQNFLVDEVNESAMNLAPEFNENFQNDSLFSYFDFDEQGGRVRYTSDSTKTLVKRASERTNLILDSEEQFVALEESIEEKVNHDREYRHSIERPLDYVCRTSLLALNEMYETVVLSSGDTLLNDRILKENCEYIGFECEKCDESADEDPYLKESRKLKKELKEIASFESSVSVEIYPYRMLARSFITNIKSLYSSAGAETYFKKRQRVWRGPFKGMVWRWADFDPDRNGVRAYCFDACGISEDMHALACTKPRSSSDLDTWGDTEDITERCELSFGVNISGKIGEGGTFYDIKMSPIQSTVKNFKGGVVGMHYVHHKDYEFKAKTSKGFSSDVQLLMNSYPSFNYR